MVFLFPFLKKIFTTEIDKEIKSTRRRGKPPHPLKRKIAKTRSKRTGRIAADAATG
jgi:hypothetical protein